MNLARPADAAAFLAAAGAFLATDEVRNNAPLSLARALADGTRVPAAAPWFGVVDDGMQVVAAALRTPPFKLVLTDAAAAAIEPLADALLHDAPDLPGVVAPQATAARFADAWCTRSGQSARVTMRLRLHRLRRVADDLPPARGTLERATAADRTLALAWFTAFAREATPDAPDEAADAVERFLRSERLHLWHDPEPVTLVGIVGRTERGARIGPVYTPPALRGRGYATAAVAELSRRLMTQLDYCALYTDLANPTSNGIYARIGYTPVADFDEVSFTPAGASAAPAASVER